MLVMDAGVLWFRAGGVDKNVFIDKVNISAQSCIADCVQVVT